MHLTQLIKISFLILSVAVLAKTATTQRRKIDDESGGELIKYDAVSIHKGIIKAYRSPFSWKHNEILTFATVAAGIGFLYLYDEEISQLFRKKEASVLPILKKFGWYYGSPENHYIINAGFYLYGLISKNEEIRKTGVLLISATLAAGLLQTILKLLIGRARPLRNEGKFSLNSFTRENSYYSFPSGHSILSFTTAYAIGKQFSHPLPKAGMYAFGSIAPLSRLWAGAHWFTDAATSICLSIPIVNIIDDFLIEERNYRSGLDK
ncbi:MAG TPA: phosphatase PAP2 family protein [Gillisia sp.]|nr:phosphatase PAP2 family protein [Gillisia sp.]